MRFLMPIPIIKFQFRRNLAACPWDVKLGLKQLKWESLKKWRKESIPRILYKGLKGAASIPTNNIVYQKLSFPCISNSISRTCHLKISSLPPGYKKLALSE